MWQKVAKFKGAEYFRKALYMLRMGGLGNQTHNPGIESTILYQLSHTYSNYN
jgi:hypothetical protein